MTYEPWRSELRGLELDARAAVFEVGISAGERAVRERRVILIQNESRRRQGYAPVGADS